MEARKIFFVVFCAIILVVIVNTFSVYYFGTSIPWLILTGKGVTGVVQIIIQVGATNIIIYSPQNITYNFDVGDPYNISLNVSANFTATDWNYSLYDLRHGVWVYQDIPFTPNSSFIAVRWENRMDVEAKEFGDGWYGASVVFSVQVPNSAPVLGNISDDIYICEGKALSYNFNATDADEDTLVSDISPKNPFYTVYLGKSGYNMSLFRIFSGILGKSHVGSYGENISVDDGYNPSCCVDSAITNITVIEINNAPVMENLGAQTVWIRGENSTFYHQMDVNDTEEGKSSDGNLHFNRTFSANENLFGINSTHGIMNYTPSIGHVGVYSIEVCVWDNALSSPHQNISLCAPNNYTSISLCDNFTLTVTNINRAPEIINFTPDNSTNLNLRGTESQSFFVEVKDADGTIPDIDWYVNGILQEHNENKSNDTYTYTPKCDVEGIHIVKAFVTDGLASDSQSWNVDVSIVACSVDSAGGGGGGSLGPYCRELWACEEWNECRNAFSAFRLNNISLSKYLDIKNLCLQSNYGEDFCGYQTTGCRDFNYCNNSILKVPRPSELRVCYFTENPGCRDGIKNCHSGGCEVKVDCGGPCRACPTCSDGRKNQDEEGIDCGGPCPRKCEIEEPSGLLNILFILLGILLVIALAVIVWRVVDIIFSSKTRKKVQGKISD